MNWKLNLVLVTKDMGIGNLQISLWQSRGWIKEVRVLGKGEGLTKR